MEKLFILIYLLRSSTCFEHYCAHLQEDNCINTAPSIVTLFGWLLSTQVTRGLSSSRNLCFAKVKKQHLLSSVVDDVQVNEQ